MASWRSRSAHSEARYCRHVRHRRAAQLREPPGGCDRRHCAARQHPADHPRGPAALGPLRPRCHRCCCRSRCAAVAPGRHVALPRAAAGRRRRSAGHPGRDDDAVARRPAPGCAPGPGEPAHQGRVAPADGVLQGPRHGHGGLDGARAGGPPRGSPHRGQRRRRPGRLRCSRRHGRLGLHAGGHAHGQPLRGVALRRARLPRGRAHHRLRRHRPRRRGADGLVRHEHAQGALSHRGQEDDGPGAGRPARLAPARRRPLSHRWRHRPHRHVEGVRRAGVAGLARGARPSLACTPASRTGARPSPMPGQPESGSPSRHRTRRRSRAASACRRRWATS